MTDPFDPEGAVKAMKQALAALTYAADELDDAGPCCWLQTGKLDIASGYVLQVINHFDKGESD